MTMKRLPLVLLLALAACSDAAEPTDHSAYFLGNTLPLGPVQRESELTFPRFVAATAPVIRGASFYAKVGQQRSVQLDYGNGDVFLRFTVGPASLLRKPIGGLFLPGDSILITVVLDDSDRMIAHFEPSGLGFNPLLPARLDLFYQHANPDLDGDGDVDAADTAIQKQLKVYKQEALGLPWLQLPSLNILGINVGAGVTSFTGFAVASS
jgi:hypothetical protein